ncbi:MAG: nucleotidyltransferase domain-containing protein [Armatimonadetes bacterium]|nr:nucleotidyltransferase domain-containing protein [Armatimonadota bacterium]
MSMEQTDLQEKLGRIIRAMKAYGAEKAILFGSTARGDADRWSDIDLIVIKDTNRRFPDRQADVIDAIQPDFALDVLVYTPDEFDRMLAEENPFLTYAVEEGKVIYERPKERGEAVA